MEIKQSEFIISAVKPAQYPDDNRVEYAFVGRSNVGKSSLINMLTNRRKLVKVSGTPGKTRLINFFRLKFRPPPISSINSTFANPLAIQKSSITLLWFFKSGF